MKKTLIIALCSIVSHCYAGTYTLFISKVDKVKNASDEGQIAGRMRAGDIVQALEGRHTLSAEESKYFITRIIDLKHEEARQLMESNIVEVECATAPVKTPKTMNYRKYYFNDINTLSANLTKEDLNNEVTNKATDSAISLDSK